MLGSTTFKKSGGSNTPSTEATATGFHDLSTSIQTLFQQKADTVPYTANYLIVLTVTFQDDAADDFDDTVDGTLTTTDTVREPSTTYLSNTWGTVTRGESESQS